MDEFEQMIAELRKEVPDFGRTIGALMVDVAEGACDELVKRGIYSDRKTCVVNILTKRG